MGYIRFDTSDDLIHRHDFGLLMSYCHYLQRKYHPIDFSFEMFVKAPIAAPKSRLPRHVVVVNVIMDGLDKPYHCELAGYSHHSFTLGMKYAVEAALQRKESLNLERIHPDSS